MAVNVGTISAHLRGKRWYAGEDVVDVVELDEVEGVRHVLALVETGAQGEGPAQRAAYQCFLDDDAEDAAGHPAVMARITGRDDPPAARPLGVEQSNSSFVLEDGTMAKVFRRLHHGANPDVEVPAALGRMDVHAVLAPLSTWQVDGWDLAVLVPFLEGARDGWSIALETPEPATLAFELGSVVATLHGALASAFGASPATTSELVDVYERAAADAGSDPDPVERGRLRTMEHAGCRIRVHGDLHLGQVLLHDGQWRVIDFEGEPDRSLAERTAPASPLKDVAGMVRSFGYAAAVAGHDQHWEPLAVDAFTTGYLTSPAVASLLPSDPGPVLDAYVLEKAVYELRYEQGHRPDWTWIPQAAIDRLVVTA